MSMNPLGGLLSALLVCTNVSIVHAVESTKHFVNWESPHVHPLDSTPDGKTLLAVNTPDARLEVLSLPWLTKTQSIPVGLDPVSVRVRNNREAWVVNHISDSISIVDLKREVTIATLYTDDEPTDVVFAGNPQRAFVSCSQANTILVYDPQNPHLPPERINVAGEEPKALTVSKDGSKVFAAVFESGNSSTLVSGGFVGLFGEPPFPQGATDPDNPYGGLSPAPNDGDQFNPPLNPSLPTPPPVGVIVKKDAAGKWRDDNSKDWSAYISGDKADRSARIEGWDLIDHDLVVIDANTLDVSYVDQLMNINMALSINPKTDEISVVGTDATNEVRFEPVINGVFLRVNMATVDLDKGQVSITDLNPHLNYQQRQIPADQRKQSIGDPRAVVWDNRGEHVYVAGMGSNNIVVMNDKGQRDTENDVIAVGEGPTGLVFGKGNNKHLLYVLNKFDSSISIVDTWERTEIQRRSLFDPSPQAIKAGRKHLYNTVETSGLGHISCGSCHVDARTDGLAWDLGDPSGSMEAIDHQNLGFGNPILSAFFEEHHPMKGPMTTQTLQDIIGKEPLHWRGDRDSLAHFNPAFEKLQANDRQLDTEEMKEFSDFLATIHFPPNPYRDIDNTLPTDMDLSNQYTTPLLGDAGIPLPNGNAQRGLELFQAPNRLAVFDLSCNNCHTMPTGLGTAQVFDGERFSPLMDDDVPRHGLVSGDGQSNVTIKIPHLRNLHEKVGMEVSNNTSTRGFGFSHDGAVWSLAQILSSQLFLFDNIQDQADVIAFLMSFSGSDLPIKDGSDLDSPPGTLSKDSHAGVGQQITLNSLYLNQDKLSRLRKMIAMADAGKLGLVVKNRSRGFAYMGNNLFQSDRASKTLSLKKLLRRISKRNPLTFTLVPKGSEIRMGIDRDSDGIYDRDDRYTDQRNELAETHLITQED